jgi:hypothetical protein
MASAVDEVELYDQGGAKEQYLTEAFKLALNVVRAPVGCATQTWRAGVFIPAVDMEIEARVIHEIGVRDDHEIAKLTLELSLLRRQAAEKDLTIRELRDSLSRLASFASSESVQVWHDAEIGRQGLWTRDGEDYSGDDSETDGV